MYTVCDERLDDTKIIHDRKFMMNLFDNIADEITEFKTIQTYEFENKKTEFVATSQTKSIPYSKLIDELFSTKDDDNKNRTAILEKFAKVAIEAMLRELENEKKATYKYLAVSESSFSYDHCLQPVKDAMLGMMVVNDLVESSFAGVTAQVQCYGWIGLHAAAAVSAMSRNNFLTRPTMKKHMSKGEKSLFHGLFEELKITAMMAAMEDSPATQQSNIASTDTHRAIKQKRKS